MTLTTDQRRKRVRSRLEELRFWMDRQAIDLADWRFNGEPLRVGEPWPAREGVVELSHPQIHLPGGWTLEATRLDLDVGGESLLRICYPNGTDEPFGLDAFHKRFPVRERAFALEVSAVARFPFGRPNRDPRIEYARLALTEPAVERLVRRLQLIVETARVLGSHDAVPPLLAAAERALDALHWPSATGEYLARVRGSTQMQSIWELPALDAPRRPLSEAELESVEAAATGLEGDLRDLQNRFPPDGLIALTGHAHIDLAWLWPMDETRRKARRTFATVLALMERFPELTFNQSTAQLYAFVEEDDPTLFALIRERVALGQWEPVGGMWVEPDTNMPSGESLVRQLLYGQRYFRRHFGTTHTVCWLPDVFGFTPALPQLLKGAGIDNFFTIKLTWSETNVFPYDLFWWEGLDGSRVLAHTFNNPGGEDTDTSGYNADPGPAALVDTWRNYRGRFQFPESLLSIGYGDGGGSVTMEMLERERELRTFPALPATRFTTVREFFERAGTAVAGKDLPVWVGELYLELHRGTLTSQGRIKYLHRRAERDLVAAEVVSSMHRLLGGPEPESLERLWRIVLRNEFHDILPGSSIREVYERAEAELAGVVEEAAAIADGALDGIVQQLVPPGDHNALLAVNPGLSARPLRLELESGVPGAQPVEGGSVVAGGARVPGLGALAVVEAGTLPGLSVSPEHLENSYLRVQVAADGTLTSVLDKRTGREALAAPANRIWAYVDKPSAWDAWDVDAGYAGAGEEIPASEPPVVVEEGPHRVAVRVVRRFRSSTITQDIRLWSNSPRLEFRTTMDWHDRRWLVKARFPVAVRANTASFETAFGVIERSTHRNTTWDSARFEVAAHRFADLSEPGYGVALLNDGRYGHHVLGSELGISLLRSPTYPDPLADEGVQTFTYALLPHPGGLDEGSVLMEADDLNRPLLARPVMAADDVVWQAIEARGISLELGTLKVLEDGGGLVLRAYEPYGARGWATVTPPPGWSLDAVLDLLEGDRGAPGPFFTPFQVRSWRLRPSG